MKDEIVKTYTIISFVFLILLSSGCNSHITAEKLTGMSQDEVRDLLGEPDNISEAKNYALSPGASEEEIRKHGDQNGEYWTYSGSFPGTSKTIAFNLNGKVKGVYRTDDIF